MLEKKKTLWFHRARKSSVAWMCMCDITPKLHFTRFMTARWIVYTFATSHTINVSFRRRIFLIWIFSNGHHRVCEWDFTIFYIYIFFITVSFKCTVCDNEACVHKVHFTISVHCISVSFEYGPLWIFKPEHHLKQLWSVFSWKEDELSAFAKC